MGKPKLKRRVKRAAAPRRGGVLRGADDELIRMAEVVRVLGVTRPTVYALVKRGVIPQPVHLTQWAPRWSRRAIEEAVDALQKGAKDGEASNGDRVG